MKYTFQMFDSKMSKEEKLYFYSIEVNATSHEEAVNKARSVHSMFGWTEADLPFLKTLYSLCNKELKESKH